MNFKKQECYEIYHSELNDILCDVYQRVIIVDPDIFPFPSTVIYARDSYKVKDILKDLPSRRHPSLNFWELPSFMADLIEKGVIPSSENKMYVVHWDARDID